MPRLAKKMLGTLLGLLLIIAAIWLLFPVIKTVAIIIIGLILLVWGISILKKR